MKPASTDLALEKIIDRLASSNSHPIARVYYQDDAGEWWPLDDVLSVTVNRSAVDSRFSSFSLLPPAGTASVQMQNRGGKYTPGAGGDFDGILTRNRPLRIKMGYEIDNDDHVEATLALPSVAGKYWHTENRSGRVHPTEASEAGPEDLVGLSFNEYGGFTYGSETYAAQGYLRTSIIDLSSAGVLDLVGLEVAAGTDKIDVYFRSGRTESELGARPFQFAGTTDPAGRVLTVRPGLNRYCQVALIFRGSSWTDPTLWAESLRLVGASGLELFDLGTFLSDDPTFDVGPGSKGAQFSARDHWKKAIETKVSIPTLTNVDASEVLRRAAKKCGMKYTAESIPDTGTIISIPAAQGFTNAAPKDIFGEVLDYLFAVDINDINWRLDVSDGVLRLWEKPVSAIVPDYALEYQRDIFSLSKQYSSNSLLQRATVFSKESAVEAEVVLRDYTVSVTGHSIPPDGTGATWEAYNLVRLSWSGYAVYKNVEVYFKDSAAGVSVQIVETNMQDILIQVDRGVSDLAHVQMVVHGCKFSGAHNYEGEALASKNHIITRAIQGTDGEDQTRDGITQKWVNRFIKSDAEAKKIADKMVAEYGDKAFQISVTVPGLPFVEIGDKYMVLEKNTGTLSIFVVDSIAHTFTASGAKFRTSLQLSDLGLSLEEFIYDKNGLVEGVLDYPHDVGLLWDQDVIGDSDPDPVSSAQFRMG